MRRLNPFNGLEISLQDASYWTIETTNAVKQRMSDWCSPGVVNGLTVFSSGTQAGKAAFTLGVAYDSNGERIAPATLTDNIAYGQAALNTASTYKIALRFSDGNDGTSGIGVDGSSNFRHITDSYSVVVAKTGADTLQSSDVILAQVYSTVNGGTLIIDRTVRQVWGPAVVSPDGTKRNKLGISDAGVLTLTTIT